MSIYHCPKCSYNYDNAFDPAEEFIDDEGNLCLSCSDCNINEDKQINLDKLNKYIEENPQTSNAKANELSKKKHHERIRTKEQMEKLDKYMAKSDKRIEKASKGLFKTDNKGVQDE